MALFQVGIDVSRYQGSINWSAVAAAGKQFAIVRIGSSNNNGAYVDPYFLQNVNGAHAAGLRVGAYYYTYARTESAVARELTTFLNALEGLQLEYPVFVDVEARSLTSLGKPQLTNLVKYAMDILNQRKWYAGWYSYTNYINSYMNASALANYPLWVADYRSSLGYTGQGLCFLIKSKPFADRDLRHSCFPSCFYQRQYRIILSADTASEVRQLLSQKRR